MQQALALFDETLNVEVLLTKRENQWFDRKSIRTEAKDIANWMIGFANADGGRLVIGIHNGQIEGVDSSQERVNDLLQAALDHTVPPVRHAYSFLDCTNNRSQPDRLLLLDIEASEGLHRNRRQECFLRVGDENRRLSLSEERELVFDKGEAKYDTSIVEDLTLNDLDMAAVEAYAEKVGASDVAARMRSRGL